MTYMWQTAQISVHINAFSYFLFLYIITKTKNCPSTLNVMSLDKDIQKSIDGSGDVWQNKITRRRLASYKSQYPYIEDIFIYYIDEERVISSNTVVSAPLFFDVYGDMDVSYEEWQEFMRQDFSKQDVSRKNGDGKETLWILHTWSALSESSSQAVVGVKFNTVYVQGLADNFSEDNYVGVTIRNGDAIWWWKKYEEMTPGKYRELNLLDTGDKE